MINNFFISKRIKIVFFYPKLKLRRTNEVMCRRNEVQLKMDNLHSYKFYRVINTQSNNNIPLRQITELLSSYSL